MHTLKQSQHQCVPLKKHELLNLNHPFEQFQIKKFGRLPNSAVAFARGRQAWVPRTPWLIQSQGKTPKAHSKPGQSPEDMLCLAMLCYVLVCYALLCYAKLCYAMPPFAMLSQARSGIFRHPQASARSSKLCNANHCKTMYKKKHLIGVAPGSFR